MLGDHEASSAPEVGRSETLQQRKKGFLADEKVGRKSGPKSLAWVEKGQKAPSL